MSPFGFYLADLPNNPNSINGVNVAYIADAEMGIARYDYYQAAGQAAPQWNFSYYIDSTGSFKDSVYTLDSQGNITPTAAFDSTNPIPSSNPNADPSKVGGVRELTGRVVNGQVELFAVSGFGTGAQPNPGGSVIEVTDPAALTVPGNFLNTTDTLTTLATNPTSDPAELTGIAFSPTVSVATAVDVLPAVSLTASAQSVNDVGGTFSVQVQLSSASNLPVTIPFTLGGTAVAGTNYTAVTASPLVIPAGQTSGTITFNALQDASFHPNTTLIVGLGTPTNATLGATTSDTVTIDVTPQVTTFSVEKGLAERSYIRYLDVTFNEPVANLTLNASTVSLTHYDLNGANPTPVNLSGVAFHLVDHVMELDFGAGGIGGNENLA